MRRGYFERAKEKKDERARPVLCRRRDVPTVNYFGGKIPQKFPARVCRFR